MKMFYNKSKYGLVLMVVLAMVVQMLAPIASEYIYAQEEDNPEKVMLKETEEKEDGIEDETKAENSEADSEDKLEENNESSDSAEEEIPELPEKTGEGEEPKKEVKPDVDSDETVEEENKEKNKDEAMSTNLLKDETTILAAPKDLGNIFTLSSFKVNGEEADENQVVFIEDGTEVTLDYIWDTEGEDAKAGDFAEIDVPDAFKFDRNFESKDIELKDGTVVGTYSLNNNKIRFEFNENIEKGTVKNGTLGFGVKFNEEKFREDVVEEIEFKDSSNKTITIIGKPSKTISFINKEGVPDSSQDAKEITWTIDIANPSSTDITNPKLIDIIPEGLEFKEVSAKVYNLTIGLDGEFTQGSEVSNTPTVDGQKLEFNFANMEAYRGYRVVYITTITDYSKTQFTNNANLVYDDQSLPAEATVDVERSSGIEKYGRKADSKDTLDWWIDINKSGGTIGEAIIEDTLPEGNKLVNFPGKDQKIVLAKLTKDGDDWTETILDTVINEFPVKLEEFNLGELGSDDAYRLKFQTKIDYSQVNGGEYQKDNSFTNKTVLKDGEDEIGEAEATVEVKREPILNKYGRANVNYENKEIDWGIYVNSPEQSLKGIYVKDIVPKGLEVDEDSVKVFIYDDSKREITGEKNITFTPNTTDGTTEIRVDLGDIDKKHKIEYKTTITDFSIDKFKNKASIGSTGDGSGIGTGKDKEISGTVTVPKNKYAKDFTGIDYNEKTMSWKITADPRREAIKELTITDTFPNKGLILLEDSLEVKLGTATLTRDTDYTLTPGTEDGVEGYQKGFILEFIGDKLPLNNKITITFKTSYDPEEGIDPNTGDGLYKNSVNFKGKTESEIEIDETRDAEKQVREESWNHGKKVGKLKSIDSSGALVDGWISGNERRIEWQVYTNYLEQNLGTGVTIRDDLDYEGVIDEDSIKVRKYSVASGGDITLVASKSTTFDSSKISLLSAIPEDDYTIEMDEYKKGFTITFNKEVNERYAVIFTTSVPDISQKTYTNTATLTAGGKEYPYTGSIGFDEADNNLSKESLNVDGNKVYTDDEINWKIKINEGLSIIQKDVRIVDTISSGMVYKNDSLKVYKLQGEERVFVDPESEEGYTLEVDSNDDNETVLTILFKESIDSKYEIEYSTVVIATDGTVNNKVDYTGKNLETKTVETTELKAEQFSYIGGEWDPKKGKIKVIKTDEEENTITDLNAKFVLWYDLNGEDVKFGDREFETENGELEIGNLPLNRTYYLEEVEAPAGYTPYEGRFEITVEEPAKTKTYEQKVENKKIKINVTGNKEWIGGPTPRPTIELQLYRNGEALGNPVELMDGTTNYTWVSLDKTDDKGVDYKYTVKEIKVPAGYTKKEDGLKVTNTVDKGNIKFNKVTNIGRPLEGAEFKIYEATDEQFKTPIISENADKDGVVVSNKNGEVIFQGVDYNNYVIRETKAPLGYYKTNKLIKVKFDDFIENETTVIKEDLKNNRIVYDKDSLELTKLGEDKEVLEGAVFELVQNGVVKYTSDPTGADGKVRFDNINYGTYTVREKIAPEGYNLGTKTQEISITTDGQVKTLEFKNTKIKGDIKLIKVDNEGNLLEGAEFALYDLDDEIVGEKVESNKDGEVIFEGVAYGKYTIRETKAPEGYKINKKEYKVEIKENGATVVKDMEGEDLKVENTIIPDPEEPTDPTDPEDPDPTDPEDPEPTDPEDPEPTDPTDPSEPGKPTDPEKPKPGKPEDPTKPTDPKDPTGPVVPIDPSDPSGPTGPGKPTPTDPDGEGLVRTGTDINFLIPIGLILMLIGAAFVYREKKVKDK